ncbi:MAG: hypothetical protein ACP5M8_04975 [Caldisphaera sp.]
MRISKMFLESSTDCAKTILKNCIDKKIRCRDPPLATSRLLRIIGLSEYQERNYWKIARDLIKQPKFILYKFGAVEFSLSFEVKTEKIYHINGIPIDYIDCRLLNKECKVTNKGYTFYVYLIGKIEKSYIKSNSVNLLNILSMYNKDIVLGLLDSIRSSISNGPAGLESLIENILWILKISTVDLILPKIPKSIPELLKYSPMLRKLAKDQNYLT